MSSWYRVGSLSVANGATAVVGDGTQWLNHVFAGSALLLAGQVVEIESVTDNTHLTLTEPWSGASQSDASYAVMVSLGDLTNAQLANRLAALFDDWQTSLDDWVGYLAGPDTVSVHDGNGGLLSVATPSRVQAVVSGQLNKDITSVSDVTLSSLEARNAFLLLSGALVVPINVIIPAAYKLFYVRNTTSGGQTVTIKPVGGTGFAVAPGMAYVLVCDGSTIRQIDSGLGDDISVLQGQVTALQRLAVRTVAGASDSLGGAAKGKTNVYTSNSAITATLQTAASGGFVVGDYLDLVQAGDGQITVEEGSGVSIISTQTFKSSGKGAVMTLFMISTNTWILTGEREAA